MGLDVEKLLYRLSRFKTVNFIATLIRAQSRLITIGHDYNTLHPNLEEKKKPLQKANVASFTF